MSIASIEPDAALAEVLNDNVIVDTSGNAKRTVRAYPSRMHPNTDLPHEYIIVYPNGVIQSVTKPIGLYRGNLAVAIYVETQSNGTIKQHRIRQIIEQCEAMVNEQSYGGFHYELDPANVITPTTTNISTGYSTTILNVSWHTTHG